MTEEKSKKKVKSRFAELRNAPNILTTLRVFTIPIIMVLLLWDNRIFNLFAAITFVLASITDTIDGYLARRRKKTDAAGQLLDPLADKLLLTAALLMLVGLTRFPAWLATVIIGREIMLTGLRGIATTEGIIIKASHWAKAKTVFYSAGITGLMLGVKNEFWGINWEFVGFVLVIVGVVISIYSALAYFKFFYDKLTKKTTE